MPVTPQDHWTYTLDEWGTKEKFVSLLNHIEGDIQTIYDIGANVGAWSFVIRGRYPKADIYAWEPYMPNYNALIEMEPTVTAFPEGIYYGKTESRACCRGDSNIGAIFVEYIPAGPPMQEHSGQKLILRELESYDIPKPDLIKMDIEGAEENVLANSEICKNAPWLIVEWHPSTDPIKFFAERLPRHRVVFDIDNIQFLLCIK